MDATHILITGKPQKSEMLPFATEKKNKLAAHYAQTSKCLRCGTDYRY
jgi:hypothetical protein